MGALMADLAGGGGEAFGPGGSSSTRPAAQHSPATPAPSSLAYIRLPRYFADGPLGPDKPTPPAPAVGAGGGL